MHSSNRTRPKLHDVGATETFNYLTFNYPLFLKNMNFLCFEYPHFILFFIFLLLFKYSCLHFHKYDWFLFMGMFFNIQKPILFF